MTFSFQKTVDLYNKRAIAGDRASQNPTVYFPTNFFAGEGVKVGGFVWRDTTNPETEVVAAGTGSPLGFVERTINHDNFDVSVEGTLAIPEGGNVTVATKGDFFVAADGAVSVGDTVYADKTTGAVSFTSGDGVVDTGYKALTSATAAGELVIIGNW
jgi:hypothetical protein